MAWLASECAPSCGGPTGAGRAGRALPRWTAGLLAGGAASVPCYTTVQVRDRADRLPAIGPLNLFVLPPCESIGGGGGSLQINCVAPVGYVETCAAIAVR